jgi:hypothetical protein
MADRYWVGGTGTWDATTTTNWAATSGGAGGASAPTSADNAYFDANSNTLLLPFTVTLSSSPVCADLIIGDGSTVTALDGTMTLAGTAINIDVYGSLYFPATNLTRTFTGVVRFAASSGSYTFTTNGVTLAASASGSAAVSFGAIVDSTATWALGSALTISTGLISHVSGTLSTANYNITVAASYSATGAVAKTFNAGSSTITASFNYSGSNLTFNAGTSSIVSSAANPTFTGGVTFYNVSFTSGASGGVTINGSNTFNNLTFASRSAAGLRTVVLGANQTVNGTLTLGPANTAVSRMIVQSSVVGTRLTITLNGTLAALADVDFRDIGAAGTVATPWTGTRLGNGLNNNNITFDASKDVYWNLAAGGNWSATGWALSSGGAVDVNNFPLAQDRAIIENTGLNTSATITINFNWWIGDLDLSARSDAMTLANGVNVPRIYKNVTLSSAVTMTGTGAWQFLGQGATQILDVNTATFTPPITIDSPSGTLQLAENTTCSATVTLTTGTLDLNNQTLTTGLWTSNNSNVRSIAFGTGQIDVTSNNANIFNMGAMTGFSFTGTSKVNFTYSGAVGNRAISSATIAGGATEANALNMNFTAGTDTIVFGSSRLYRTLDFTGFAGTLNNYTNLIYGNFIISSGMTLAAGASGTLFFATSGTKQITTAGKTFDFPLTFNGIGGTFAFQDALTQGSTRTFTVTNGTVQLKNGVTSTVGAFATSGTNQKFLQSTTPGSQATLSQASGTVNVSYLSIQDINATGGATWDAYVDQGNIDAGNNDGWDFGISPVVGGNEYTYQLRSFTQPRRF